MAKKKNTPAKKRPVKKAAAKPPVKKPAAKTISHKPVPKSAKPTKPVTKPAASKPAAPAAKAAPLAKGKAVPAAPAKRPLLERKAAPKAIAFSLDEVREIAKKNEKHAESSARTDKHSKATAGAKPAHHAADHAKPHKPHHVKTASLADILGFNPAKGKKARAAMVDESEVPEKYRRYYRLLLELRTHVLTQLGEHTEETLLKSSKDDSGDLSGYGQHMADAGTDTFDRDFALSLVSNEQEALAEIEAAIKRVHAGTYGICETTQKPIAKERLLAVPFTRYSTEAKREVERHSHRAIERGGLFGDGTEEEGGKLANGGDDE
jgi:DnaK suppressor protein